jgi:xylulokinase
LRIEALSGEVTEWCRTQLHGLDGGVLRDWDAIVAECETVPAGAGGLVFVPHVFGSYGPRHDELARGAFVGLTGASTRAAITRSVFEGLSFQTRASLDALTAATGVDAGRVLVMGGGVKNRMWLQARADALGRSVEVVEDPDVTPRGAAMLAGMGVGLFDDFHAAVERFAPPTRRVDPSPGAARLYERLFDEVYVPLQDALTPINHRLARHADKEDES